MRYMFLIYSQELPGGPPAEEVEGLIRSHGAIMKEAADKRVLLSVEGLKPTSTATSIRVKDGKPITLDGPFAETKELIAGYAILQFASHAEAIEWTKRFVEVDAPGRLGAESECEIRPFYEGSHCGVPPSGENAKPENPQ